MEKRMLRGMTRKVGAVLIAGGCLAAVTASPALATPPVVKEGNFEYGDGDGSAWGNVSCHARLVINKNHPSDGPNEGGKEVEKCVSTEPGGKLTGYFTPGEEYTGYWESDFYHFLAPMFGGENTSKLPTTVRIKVAKNFESFHVYATYPAEG
jgi:hypothetical protein